MFLKFVEVVTEIVWLLPPLLQMKIERYQLIFLEEVGAC